MADTITITAAEQEDGLLVITASTLELGSQYDQRAKEFSFVRPPGRDAESLWLFFLAGTDKKSLNLGAGNTFAIPNSLTQTHGKVGFQLGFEGENETRELSNMLDFNLRKSLESSKEPPEPWPPA